MCFLQGFDGLVICFEFSQLLLIVSTPVIELLFDFLQIFFHIHGFFTIFSFKVSLLLRGGLLEHLILSLSLLPLFMVILLDFFEPGLEFSVVPCLYDLHLLFADYLIGFFENHLHLFLLYVLQGRLVGSIFLVFGVQVEDHFGQLSDLLGHLVVSLFRRLGT